MTHDEMVALIRDGVPTTGGVWADFGAGTGHFTRALRDLLGDGAVIYAIDRDQHALALLRDRWPNGDTLHIIHADFTQPLNLPPLDGLLAANALHFVADQLAVVRRLSSYLRPNGCFLLVEYDVVASRSWIPYPIPFQRFAALATQTNLTRPARVGWRRSPSTGLAMYAALAARLADS